MTVAATTIEEVFKELLPEEQEEVFARLEVIIYGEEQANRISQELATHKVTPLSEQEAKAQIETRLR